MSEDQERVREEEWLARLASEYSGELPYRTEGEVLHWLEERASAATDSEERKWYRRLIEEARAFGGTDDWGKLAPELVRFSRLLELLRMRGHQD